MHISGAFLLSTELHLPYLATEIEYFDSRRHRQEKAGSQQSKKRAVNEFH